MQIAGDVLAGAPLAGSAPQAAAAVAATTNYSGQILVLEARSTSLVLEARDYSVVVPDRDILVVVTYE
jgi:hypothetical protein